MIKLENYEVMGWRHAIRGMRNPMNSWKKSDSVFYEDHFGLYYIELGENDKDLMKRLRNAGTDHRKFMRQIVVYVDITAPLYWWKEFDTYKVGTVANSCSTMHKIHASEMFEEDFSIEDIESYSNDFPDDDAIHSAYCTAVQAISALNRLRYRYNETKDKKYWRAMIQLLPSSYNQLRTVSLNYEVLANIYKSRKDHKLDEWHVFCDWIKQLPYSELITGEFKEEQ